MVRFSEYFLTPRDALAVARDLGRRDIQGLIIAAVIGAGVGLWLTDAGAGLFAAGLFAALYWRIDSRWPLGLALGLLVVIPLMQFAYNRNWLFWGEDIAAALAVAVWYLLAIGVVRQVVALRATRPEPASASVPGRATPAHERPAAAPARVRAPIHAPAPTPARPARRPIGPRYAPDGELIPHDPIPFHASLRRQRVVARRVLSKIEHLRVDGIRPHSPKRPPGARP